jgi:hypothetical protein
MSGRHRDAYVGQSNGISHMRLCHISSWDSLACSDAPLRVLRQDAESGRDQRMYLCQLPWAIFAVPYRSDQVSMLYTDKQMRPLTILDSLSGRFQGLGGLTPPRKDSTKLRKYGGGLETRVQ